MPKTRTWLGGRGGKAWATAFIKAIHYWAGSPGQGHVPDTSARETSMSRMSSMPWGTGNCPTWWRNVHFISSAIRSPSVMASKTTRPP